MSKKMPQRRPLVRGPHPAVSPEKKPHPSPKESKHYWYRRHYYWPHWYDYDYDYDWYDYDWYDYDWYDYDSTDWDFYSAPRKSKGPHPSKNWQEGVDLVQEAYQAGFKAGWDAAIEYMMGEVTPEPSTQEPTQPVTPCPPIETVPPAPAPEPTPMVKPTE